MGAGGSAETMVRSEAVDRIVRAIYRAGNPPLATVATVASWTAAVEKVVQDAVSASRDVRLAVSPSPSASRSASACRVTEPENVVRVTRRIDAQLAFELVIRFAAPFRPSSYERGLLKRLALHLENGVRLVARPYDIRGRVASSGAFESYEDDGPTPLELWRSLERGQRSLAPRALPGETSYLVLEHPHGAWRALTSDECAVTERFVRGASSKAIALELGFSQPRVSRALRHAAAKVGLFSSRELIAVGAALQQVGHAAVASVGLTAAERRVLALVRLGQSNQRIADARGRSLHTIANQVASILRKTKLGSRRALAALPAGPREPLTALLQVSGVFSSARANRPAGERDPCRAAGAER